MAIHKVKIETISVALRRAGAAFWAHICSSTASTSQEVGAAQTQTHDYSGPHSESPVSGPVDTYDLRGLMPLVPGFDASRYATAQNVVQQPKENG